MMRKHEIITNKLDDLRNQLSELKKEKGLTNTDIKNRIGYSEQMIMLFLGRKRKGQSIYFVDTLHNFLKRNGKRGYEF